MITQRDDIEYVPHSRHKKYFIVVPQLRGAVKADTYQERFHFPKRTIIDQLWRDKGSAQRDALGMALVLFGLVGLYFVLYALGF